MHSRTGSSAFEQFKQLRVSLAFVPIRAGAKSGPDVGTASDTLLANETAAGTTRRLAHGLERLRQAALRFLARLFQSHPGATTVFVDELDARRLQCVPDHWMDCALTQESYSVTVQDRPGRRLRNVNASVQRASRVGRGAPTVGLLRPFRRRAFEHYIVSESLPVDFCAAVKPPVICVN